VTLIEGHLLQSGAVGTDHMQIEREFVAVLIDVWEAAFGCRAGWPIRAFIKQDCLRTCLARRCENYASIGEVLRHDVVTVFSGQVRRNDAHEFVGFECVLPDIPGRLIFVIEVEIGVDRPSHGEQQLAAVECDLDVANIALVRNLAFGNVDCKRTRGCPVAKEQVGADLKRNLLAQILLFEFTVVIKGERLHNVRYREVDNDRIGILAGANLHALIGAITRRDGYSHGKQRRQLHCRSKAYVPEYCRLPVHSVLPRMCARTHDSINGLC
jgi:hypothetical protein